MSQSGVWSSCSTVDASSRERERLFTEGEPDCKDRPDERGLVGLVGDDKSDGKDNGEEEVSEGVEGCRRVRINEWR